MSSLTYKTFTIRPEKSLEDLEAGEASVSAYYGLTTQGYEKLSSNIADLKRYLSQLKSIVKY